MAQKAGTLNFSFRVDEDYAAVCVDSIAVVSSPDNPLSSLLDRPPQQNVMLGSGDQAAAGDLKDRGKNVASQPWSKWFVAIKRAFDKLSATLFNPAGGLVVFTAWSIAEADVAWYGTFSIDDSATTVTPTLTSSSRFGQSLKTIDVTAGGDYDQVPDVIITDPDNKGGGAAATAIMNGRLVDHIAISDYGAGYLTAPTISFSGGGGAGGATATATLYPWAPGQRFLVDDNVTVSSRFTYEICEIVSIDYDSGEWTITRGVLGTTPAAHTAMRFYLLIPGRFQKVLLPTDVAPHRWKFLWPNMVVAIVEAQLLGSIVTQLTLFPADDGQGARPGLRTMSGAAYVSLGIDGALTVGQNTNRVDAGQSWETIRAQFAKVLTAPSGGSCVVLLCWIAPNGTDIGLLGTITIADGALQSYDVSTDAPRNRQMPYLYDANDPIWPPVLLTRCVGALDGFGALVETMTFGDREVYFEPNGDILAVVKTANGASDLRITLET